MSISTIFSLLFGFIAGAVTTVYFVKKKNKNGSERDNRVPYKQKIKGRGSIELTKKSLPHTNNTELDKLKQTNDKEVNHNSIIFEGRFLDAFRGQLSGIWLFANDDDLKLLLRARKNYEYISSFLKYNGTDEQVNWWSNFCKDIDSWEMPQFTKKSKQLIKIMEAQGFVIGNIPIINWNDKSEIEYNCFDEVNDGQKCKIISPVILYLDEVFEKGIVKPI